MKNVLVLGGGKVGKSVAELLLACGGGGYRVTLADRDEANLRTAAANIAQLREHVKHPVELSTTKIDASDKAQVRAALTGQDYVICMLPFNLVAGVAEMANELGVNYFDVTEDVAATEGVKKIADSGRARVALVPQCGLAPGYIAIAAYDLARDFAEIHDLTLRVGALPQYTTRALKYNVTWSASGVVNEYCEPCNVMLSGAQVKVPALEGLEHFSFEGVDYEAFYTSGGVGSLIDTLAAEGKTVNESNVAYKTIRYPGHRDLMKFFLEDLRLNVEHAAPTASGRVFDRALAVDLLEHAIARTLQDVVVVFINCVGVRGTGRSGGGGAVGGSGGGREQVNFKRTIHATTIFGRIWPAIELTTAAGVCAMVDLHRLGKVRASGFVKQEEVALAEFNKTVFGLAYENPGAIEGAVRAG